MLLSGQSDDSIDRCVRRQSVFPSNYVARELTMTHSSNANTHTHTRLTCQYKMQIHSTLYLARTICSHLGKNPLICDCNLRWLADYLDANSGVETSEARCEAPSRNQGKKMSQLGRNKFRCEGKFEPRSIQINGHVRVAWASPTGTKTRMFSVAC